MTINIHGGSQQIFEQGSNPVFNNCFSGSPAPEAIQLPEEKEEVPEPSAKEHRFPFYNENATESDKMEIEKELIKAGPKGNSALVRVLNQFSYYICIEHITDTKLFNEFVSFYGLTRKYDSFNDAMKLCKCPR